MITSHGEPAAHLGDEPFLYRRSGPVSLHLGDAPQVLAALPDASVDCLVTSPPFWGLRDYGTGSWQGDLDCPHPSTRRARRVDGSQCPRCGARRVDPQDGLEESLDDYVARLVAVFYEARRVLVETGTCWLNLGDSYSSGTTSGDRAPSPVPAKNLNGVPWKVAFALQTAGWTLRNAVVWAKTNHLSPFCLCCLVLLAGGSSRSLPHLGCPCGTVSRCSFEGTPAVRHPQAPRRRRSGSCWESGDGRGWASWCVLRERCRPRRCPVPVELQRS